MPNTDDGEVFRLRVVVELAEVPLDRLPGTTGGDAHRLVVIALGPARGEGIAEPEAVRHGHFVGDVAERGRALVRSDDEIGVVTVVTHHRRRRYDGSGDEVVGHVEQSGDEDAVARDALGEPGIAIDTRIR